jgi:aspartate/methionine/tyrosine aminotransferase
VSKDPLVRTVLPQGWIDLSIGEARVVRDILNKIHPLDSFSFQGDSTVWEYQHPSGYKPLVDFLEKKHGGRKVVMTSGAKQGLSAVFYALKQAGYSKIGLNRPYWCQLPPTISMMGLEFTTNSDYDSFLLVSPNNPDGNYDEEEMKADWEHHKGLGEPYIHDAAYYDPIYLPEGATLPHIGDMQIFSVSKKYGMSGLRLGYIVFDDQKYYSDVLHYIETSTVGTSAPAQRMFYEIQCRELAVPQLRETFELLVKAELIEARRIISQIPENILDPYHFQTGMFGWFRNVANVNFDELQVKVLDGKHSGDSGMVRINLAVGNETLKLFVKKLQNKYGF